MFLNTDQRKTLDRLTLAEVGKADPREENRASGGPPGSSCRLFKTSSRWDSVRPPPSYVTSLSKSQLQDLPSHRPRPHPPTRAPRQPGIENPERKQRRPPSCRRSGAGAALSITAPPAADPASEGQPASEKPPSGGRGHTRHISEPSRPRSRAHGCHRSGQ
uniref:Uncharacterized protein n=1 Tax=Rangifer tarandus platyrhynchus TaxID=3082113 RepID=A0ACB0FDZ9_RANTA|nr:unnamed protein product [Rangifer tarandus platyrhynchus]